MNTSSTPASVFDGSSTSGNALPAQEQASGSPLNLERYWNQALQQKYWIMGLIALGLLIGLVSTLLATEYFRATSRIEISQPNNDLTSGAQNRFNSRLGEVQ